VASSRVTRILITGGDGILASALKAYFPLADYYGRQTCDVARPEQVRMAFQNTKPELVIHCAAQTSHNAEPFSYAVTNVQGTVNVVAAAKKLGSRVVYLSTDYLGARRELDPVHPVNGYAGSKYAGEMVVSAISDGLTIRGSWYSRLELSHAATDAFTTKLPVERAAYYVATLAVSSHTGVVNIAGPRRSIYEIALEFNERVIPVSRSQIHCGYEYPADTSLNTERLTRWLAT
jgi:dTDP-4-dehydrorhamnose reductase